MTIPQRMEIWYANVPMKKDSSIQGGGRPVVIISNDICNMMSSVLTVAPMTRQLKKLTLPTHVLVDAPDGRQSVVLAEQIMPVERSMLINKMGRVPDEDVKRIEAALREQLGMGG